MFNAEGASLDPATLNLARDKLAEPRRAYIRSVRPQTRRQAALLPLDFAGGVFGAEGSGQPSYEARLQRETDQSRTRTAHRNKG